MKDSTLKEDLYQFCVGFVKARIGRIKAQIGEVQESLGAETKSSAGDKHETGRAMLQLEREKLGAQLAEAENMEKLLHKVDIAYTGTTAALGSLVKTETANYFLAISAGEYKSGKGRNYCISLNTPIGIMLLGKTVGDSFNFDGNAIEILKIH